MPKICALVCGVLLFRIVKWLCRVVCSFALALSGYKRVVCSFALTLSGYKRVTVVHCHPEMYDMSLHKMCVYVCMFSVLCVCVSVILHSEAKYLCERGNV